MPDGLMQMATSDTDSPTATKGSVFAVTVPVMVYQRRPLSSAIPALYRFQRRRNRDGGRIGGLRSVHVIVPVAVPTRVLPGRVPVPTALPRPPLPWTLERQLVSVTTPCVVPAACPQVMPCGGTAALADGVEASAPPTVMKREPVTTKEHKRRDTAVR